MIRRRNQETENHFWISISDLMSGLTMIFMLVMAIAFLNINLANDEQKEILTILDRELKNAGLSIKVDSKTGAIIIDNKILFDLNDSTLKKEGEVFLDKFIPILFRVMVKNESAKKEIIAVHIEGYSSEKYYKEMKMMQLSTERSLSVWKYVYKHKKSQYADADQKRNFIEKFTVTGFGNMKATSMKDIEEERKVVFQIQFRNVIEKLFKIASNK